MNPAEFLQQLHALISESQLPHRQVSEILYSESLLAAMRAQGDPLRSVTMPVDSGTPVAVDCRQC